jgi:hypothetical protein
MNLMNPYSNIKMFGGLGKILFGYYSVLFSGYKTDISLPKYNTLPYAIVQDMLGRRIFFAFRKFTEFTNHT